MEVLEDTDESVLMGVLLGTLAHTYITVNGPLRNISMYSKFIIYTVYAKTQN